MMEVLFLVSLVVCFWTSLASFSIPTDVYISFSSPPVASQQKQAVVSAISQVNLDSSLLPNTTLHLTDTTSPGQNPFDFAWNISQYKISSLIMDSKPTESHDALSSMLQTPLLSTRASKATPLNQSYSGYSVNIVPSTHPVMVDLITKYSWTNVIVLYDVRWRDEASLFVSSLPSTVHCHTIDMVLDQAGLLNKTTETKLRSLATDSAEAIAMFCDASLVQGIIRQVHPLRSHKIHRAHRWLLADPIGSLKLEIEDSQIVVGFAPRVVVNSKTTALMAALATNITTTRFSSFLVYDAILAYAHALHNMLVANRWQTLSTGSNIATFLNGPELLKYIKKVTATGTTGFIQFDNGCHRRNAVIDVMNTRGGIFTKIGEWSETTKLTMTSSPQKNKQITKVVPLSELQRKLKIALVEDPPFVMIEVDKLTNTKKIVGFSVDLIKGVADILKFQYEVYLSPDGKYGGTNPDGSLSGVVGEVFKGNADMSSMPLTISSERSQYLGFSKPFMYISMDLVMQKPTVKEFDITGFMTPYTIMVWVMTMATWFVVTAILTLVNYFSPYGHRMCDEEENGDEFSWFNSLWFCLASMLQQGGDSTPRMLSGRIVVGSFWFCILVWVSTYTANLAAFLTSSKNGFQVNTLEDVQEGEYNLYIMRDTALYEHFKTADYQLYRLLWEKMSTDRSFVDSGSEGFAAVRNNERTVYLEESPFSEYLVNQEPCDVMSAKDVTGSSSYGIAMSKQFPYINNISIAIVKMQELGQIGDLKRKWWDERNKCPKYKKLTTEEVVESQRIQIGSMVGVYMLLAAGGVVSIVMIFVEISWKNRRDKIHAKVRQGWAVVKGAKTVIGLQKQTTKPDEKTVIQAFQLPVKKPFTVPDRDLGITNKACDDVPIKVPAKVPFKVPAKVPAKAVPAKAVPASLDLWGAGIKTTSQAQPNEKPAKMTVAKELGMNQKSNAVPAKTSTNAQEALSKTKSPVQKNDAPKIKTKDLGKPSKDLNSASAKTPSNNSGAVSKTKPSVQTKENPRAEAKLVRYPDKSTSEDFPAKSSVEPKAPKRKSPKPKDPQKDKTKDPDNESNEELLAKIAAAKEKAKKAKKKAKRERKDDEE